MPRKDHLAAREYQRQYYAANLEHMRERARARRKQNPEYFRAATRRYYQRNRDRILKTARDQYGQHRTEYLARERRYDEWAKVKETFRPKCPYCEAEMRPLEWHGDTYLRCGGCGLETTLIEIRRIQLWEAA